jgi:hypothetical protein
MATPARARLEALLRDRKLDATLSTAHPLRPEGPAPAPSGVEALDARLGGGWPRGEVSELVGARSSGRTWLAGQALAGATCRGELAALVDATDAFEPASLKGPVEWTHLLWVRGRAWGQAPQGSAGRAAGEQIVDRAVKAAALVLQAGGFGVVVLDLGDVPAATLRQLPFTTWLRLARLVEGRDTACLVVAGDTTARSARGVSVRLASEGMSAGAWGGAHDRARWLAGLPACARIVGARWQGEDEKVVVNGRTVTSHR